MKQLVYTTILSSLVILTFCVHFSKSQNQTNMTTTSSPVFTTVQPTTTDFNFQHEYCQQGKSVWNVCWLSNPPYVYSRRSSNDSSEVVGILVEALIEGLKICGCKTKLNFKMARNNDEFMNCSNSLDVDIVVPFPAKKASGALKMWLFNIVDSPEIYLILNRDEVEADAKNRVISEFFSVWTIAVLTVLLAIIFGIIVWCLDFSWNSTEFPPTFFPGALEGVWWSFVTLTTVGYGDKTPKYPVARALAVIWMFIGMGMISLLTATMTRALTTAAFDYQTYIQQKNTIGVLNGTYTYDEAVKKGLQPYIFSDLYEMYQALSDLNNKKIAGIFVDIFVATYVKNNPSLYKLDRPVFVAKSYDVSYPLAFYMAYGVRSVPITSHNHFTECFRNTFPPANQQLDVYRFVEKYITRSSQGRETKITFENDLFEATGDTFITGSIILSCLLVFLIIIGVTWQLITTRRSESKSLTQRQQSNGYSIESIDLSSNHTQSEIKNIKLLFEKMDEVNRALDTLSEFKQMVEQYKMKTDRYKSGVINGTSGSIDNKGYSGT